MKLKALLFALALMPLAFAAWQSVAAMAIMISVLILAALYAVAIGVGSEELKALSKDEFYQLLVLVLMMVVLLGTDGILNSISQNSALTQGQPTLQDAAIASLADTQQALSDDLGIIANSDRAIAKQASQADSCTLAGGGYSVSACGGFTMLGTPFSLAGSIIGYAIAEVASVKTLVDLSKQFALSLFLPIGIILRTFKFSRGAGSFLIAFGISAFLLAPAGIIFVDMLNEQFLASPYAADYAGEPSTISADCEPGVPWGGLNENNAIGAYKDLKEDLRKYLMIVLLKATLGPVVALLLFIGGLRALMSLFGTEVDVSIIARFI
ncbi:hypothetical protein H0O02_04445 [Candidatus Micrarchaeota archaeon]|nr:hypothetical protein [Candidatus Micrarchaeota archaeon]